MGTEQRVESTVSAVPLVDPLPEPGRVVESDALIAGANHEPVFVWNVLYVANDGRPNILLCG